MKTSINNLTLDNNAKLNAREMTATAYSCEDIVINSGDITIPNNIIFSTFASNVKMDFFLFLAFSNSSSGYEAA